MKKIFIAFSMCTIFIISCDENLELPVINYSSIDLNINANITPFNCYRFKRNLVCFDRYGKGQIISNHGLKTEVKFQTDFENRIFGIHSHQDSVFLTFWKENVIKESYFLSDDYEWIETIKPKERVFYEDQDYTVTECCFGEFGGSTFFQNRKTGKILSYPSTCAVTLLKFNNAYLLATSLSHMSTHSDIVRIEDPSKLYQLLDQELANECNWWNDDVNIDNWQEKMLELEAGSERVFDTTGISILNIFEFDNQILSINSDYSRTFLTTLVGNQFVEVAELINKGISPIKYKLNHSTNGFTIFSKNHEWEGVIELFNDTIKITNFKE